MNWFNKNKDTPTRDIDGKHKNYPTSMRLVTVFPVTSNKETVLCCDITHAPSNNNKKILGQRRSLDYSQHFAKTSPTYCPDDWHKT